MHGPDGDAGILMPMSALARFAWGTLVLNVGVVLLGAFVRATGSGAGCGRSWPTCDGQVIPAALEGARSIEFSHRAASGVALLAVALLVVWVLRATPKGHAARTAALWSGVAIVSESLIGAMLVLAQWVADDTSAARTVAVPLHLVNTFVLLAALALTAWWLSLGRPAERSNDPALVRPLRLGAAGMLLIGATGAITALADTLFPAESLIEGLRQDVSGTAELLGQLRVIHPVVAVVVGAYLAKVAWSRAADTDRIWVQRFGLTVIAVVATQLFAGIANVILLTPIWMQLIHLLLADVLWVAFVLFGAAALERHVAPATV